MSDCVCVCMYMNKEKAVHLKDYLCSSFNNNAQSDKTTNKLSISQMSSQHYIISSSKISMTVLSISMFWLRKLSRKLWS